MFVCQEDFLLGRATGRENQDENGQTRVESVAAVNQLQVAVT